MILQTHVSIGNWQLQVNNIVCNSTFYSGVISTVSVPPIILVLWFVSQISYSTNMLLYYTDYETYFEMFK